MTRLQRAVARLLVLGSAFAGPIAAAPQMDRPLDADAIERGMRAVIERLDSPAYERAVSWDEHVVLCYELARGREPTSRELFLLREVRADLGISRGTVLSIALRGERPALGWGRCRDFLRRVDPERLRVDEGVRRRARRLVAAPRARLLEPKVRRAVPEGPGGRESSQTRKLVPHVRYRTYFGYLHAHSELSDGEGSPLDAYRHARDAAGLDFFALTDHGELLAIWPWENKWDELKDAAETTHRPGSFVTLWGFEWSHPLQGHVNVLNTPDFTGVLSEDELVDLYDWIVARPAAIARFNHPGRYDDGGTEFLHMLPYPPVAEQMVGIATWNKGDSFDRYYYDGGWFSSYSYFDEGNGQGWTLGALGGQDNHRQDWGTRNAYRTAVLALELTRPGVLDAYRNRRFYATEDEDLHLDVRCRGFPMGARLPDGPRRLSVEAWDAGGDTFEEVRLYRDGILVDTRSASGSTAHVLFDDSASSEPHYYYVIVRQTDDGDGNGRNDEAISSPIWIGL